MLPLQLKSVSWCCCCYRCWCCSCAAAAVVVIIVVRVAKATAAAAATTASFLIKQCKQQKAKKKLKKIYIYNTKSQPSSSWLVCELWVAQSRLLVSAQKTQSSSFRTGWLSFRTNELKNVHLPSFFSLAAATATDRVGLSVRRCEVIWPKGLTWFNSGSCISAAAWSFCAVPVFMAIGISGRWCLESSQLFHFYLPANNAKEICMWTAF